MLGRRGVKNLPMLMKASHIRENILTKQEAADLGLNTSSRINYHGLGEELFKKVIESLDDIDVAYRGTPRANDPSRRENSFLLLSSVKDGDGNTIVVPVYINEMGSYNRVFMQTNRIASVYGKSGLSDYIKREVAKGNLVRIKKEAPPTVNPRLQLPSIIMASLLRRRRQTSLRWPPIILVYAHLPKIAIPKLKNLRETSWRIIRPPRLITVCAT